MPNNENREAVSLANELNYLLADHNVKAKQLSKTLQDRVVAMSRLAKLEESGNQLSERQLGYMRGSITAIQNSISNYDKLNKFKKAGNDLLKENKDLFSSLSKEQKNIFMQTWQNAQNVKLTEEERIELQKEALIILQKQAKAYNIQKEALEEYTGWVDDYKKQWQKTGAVIKGVISSPMTAGIVAMGILINKVGKWKDAIKEVKKELGLSVSQTAQATATIGEAQAKASIYGTTVEETSQAYAAIINETGNLEAATANATAQAAKFMKLTGLSADEVAKVQMTFEEMPGASEEFSADMMNFAKDMSRANNVPLGKVMKDIGANTEAFAIAGKDGAENLIKATIMANKLGVSMSQLDKTANGLLDIESSLASEMEASVLIGREMNLDKAREYALADDYVGLQQEILKNVGSVEEFNKMDRIQRQAVADAVGMEVGDLAKIVNNQGEVNKLNFEGLTLEQQKQAELDDQLDKGAGILSWLTLENALLGIAAFKFLGIGKIVGGLLGSVSKMPGFLGKAVGALTGAGKVPATPEMTGGGKAGANMTGISSGLKAMGSGKVLLGTAALAALGLALVVLTPGLPALFLLSIPGIGVAFGTNVAAMGQGVSSLGKNKELWKGVAAMFLLSLALLPFAAALYLIKDVPIENIIAFSIAVPLLGLAAAGLGFLLPYIAAGALAIALVGGALAIFGMGLASGAEGFGILSSMSESFMVMASAAAGIFIFAGAIGMLALSFIGLAASLLILAPMLPILAAAVALGVDVNGAMGGGSSKGKEGESEGGGETGNDAILAKLDELIAVVQAGAVITMDGNKVGNSVVKFVNLNSGSPASGQKMIK